MANEEQYLGNESLREISIEKRGDDDALHSFIYRYEAGQEDLVINTMWDHALDDERPYFNNFNILDAAILSYQMGRKYDPEYEK